MKSNTTLRDLFDTADSISLGDEFIRYFSPESDGEFEIAITIDDDRYEFTSEAIDKATFDDSSWSIYCEFNKQNVDVRFYQVHDITSESDG